MRAFLGPLLRLIRFSEIRGKLYFSSSSYIREFGTYLRIYTFPEFDLVGIVRRCGILRDVDIIALLTKESNTFKKEGRFEHQNRCRTQDLNQQKRQQRKEEQHPESKSHLTTRVCRDVFSCATAVGMKMCSIAIDASACGTSSTSDEKPVDNCTSCDWTWEYLWCERPRESIVQPLEFRWDSGVVSKEVNSGTLTTFRI